MKRVIECHTEKLIQRGVIGESERELYGYGIDVIMVTMCPIISIYCVGLIVDCLSEITMFLCGFISLRIYLGGYHCSTRKRCYFAMLALFGLLFLLLYLVPKRLYCFITVTGAIVSFLLVSKLESVVHFNKQLTLERIMKCSKLVKKVCFVECFISVFGNVINRDVRIKDR